MLLWFQGAFEPIWVVRKSVDGLNAVQLHSVVAVLAPLDLAFFACCAEEQ